MVFAIRLKIEILFATLGLKCFQSMEGTDIEKKIILHCSDKHGNFGKGEYTEEGFLLYKGAICKLELHRGTDSIPMRDEMICSGQLKAENKHYILQENKLFSSVSSAASIILARQANGWSEWKNKDGKSLDDLIRKHT
jgi:hypothetical protein